MDVQPQTMSSERMVVANKVDARKQKELDHSFRLFWTQLALALIFTLVMVVAGAGYSTASQDLLWVALSSGGLGVVFLLLALDSWGQCREIRGRHWTSLTPRFPTKVRTSQEDPVSTEIGKPIISG